MSKPTKTEAQLIAMAKEELKVHLDCPDGIKEEFHDARHPLS